MPTTHYQWDELSDNVLADTNDSGITTAVYTNEPNEFGELVSQPRDGVTSFYEYDAQKSTQQLSDSSGMVTDTALYSAFGEKVANSGTTQNPFGYKGAIGYYADGETDELYVRARHLSPTLGRWSSVDPIDNQDGVNWYEYAHNNPISNSDPSGCVVVEAGLREEPHCRRLEGNQAFIFSLPGRWPCRSDSGFYIQQVDVRCRLCGCDPHGECIEDAFTYWEAFPVTRLRRGTPKETDTAIWMTTNLRGSYRQIGTVKFYCVSPDRERRPGEILESELSIEPTGPIDPDEHICVTSSGDLAWVTEKPDWWDLPSVDQGEFGHRRFAMYWNCCCDPESQWAYINSDPD